MSKFSTVALWALLGALAGTAVVACSSSDDLTPKNSGQSTGGSSGSSTSAGGNAGTNSSGSSGASGSTQGMNIEVTTGEITSDTEWPAGSTVTIKKGIYVFVRSGATLKIGAGTTIKGENNTAVVIDRGAKIMAEGTKDAPIVFTSAVAVGNRTPGDWGGLVLVGKAKTNDPGGEGDAEGFSSANVKYGGSDDADSSGVLRFVRVEFAGFQISDGNELNGLTMYSVGSGTTIEHVQSHFGLDDAFEWFGGTVNVKWLLATGQQDDGFDWDRGWRGKGQFMAVVQDEASPGDNGIEADNRKGGVTDEPWSNPTVYNVTLVGKTAGMGSGHGIMFKEGTRGTVMNALIYGFSGSCVKVQGTQTATNAGDNSLKLQNSLVGCATNFQPDQDDLDENAWYSKSEFNNRAMAGGMVKISDDKVGSVNLALPADSPALSGGATPPSDGFFDTTATFVGACGSSCAAFEGWTSYPVN
jgi:hypothetical protein